MQAKKIGNSETEQFEETTISRLNTDIHIILHTRIAQSLFDGSWKIGKMGLIQFAKVMTAIWNAARNDDPYAEWYLMRTYQVIEKNREKLRSIESSLTREFNNIRGISINSSVNTHPVNYPLQFSNPFGFMGAYLISDADFIIRQVLTLERIGIIPADDISIKQIAGLVQDVFSEPRSWRNTNVTRKDIHDNNQIAKHAKSVLGDLPNAVFCKELSFSYLPKAKPKGDANA